MADERNRIEQADRLDAFWDDMVRGNGQFAPSPSGSPDELENFALAQRLQDIAPADDGAAQQRLRRRLLGAGMLTAEGMQPLDELPANPNGHVPAGANPAARGRISQVVSFAAMAALLVMVTGGFFLVNGNRGWFGSDDPGVTPPAPVAALSQATPASIPSQLSAESRAGVLWERSPAGGERRSESRTALVDDTIYRLTDAEGFSGVESIDAATGAVNWTMSLGWTGQAADADAQAVYVPVSSAENGSGAVVALGSENGEELWTTSTATAVVGLVAADGALYAWDGHNHLTALDATTGAELWQGTSEWDSEPTSDETPRFPTPVIAGDVVIVVDSAGHVVGFDRSVGVARWTMYKFDSNQVEFAVSANGPVVMIGPDSPNDGEPALPNFMTLVGFDPAEGEVLWEQPILSPSPSIAVSDSTVFVVADTPFQHPEAATEDRSGTPLRVFGLDLATGEMLWVSDQGGVPYTSVSTYAPDQSLVLAISDKGRMTSLSATDGTTVGIHDLGHTIVGPVTGDSDGVFPTLVDGSLLRLDPDVLDGTTGIQANQEIAEDSVIDWTLPLSMKDGRFVELGGMTFANGIVYRLIETADSRSVQAVYGQTGALAWQVPIEWSDAGISADASGVYLVDQGNQVVALDPFTGEQLWSEFVSEVGVTGFVLDGQKLYASIETNGMAALDTADGSLIWGTPTGDAGRPDPYNVPPTAPIMADGTLVMISTSGTLLAFDPESGEILWSKPGFDSIAAGLAYQPGIVFVLRDDARPNDGAESMTGTALDLETGDVKWTIELEGPLYQPVATNETIFYVIANEVAAHSEAAAKHEPIVDADGPSPGSWTGSQAADEEPYIGGTHVFGLDAATGEVLWSRSSVAGGFIQLQTGCPNSCGLTAITSDGYNVGLNREDGSISGNPPQFEGEPVQVISGGSGEFGDFATLADGALVAFGQVPFREQG
jgi:outer membrane protein assembly factor BamB